MRIRRRATHDEDKIELQMVPMIDIVFQLLIFFIMTFKIVTQEGDFNIKMPLAANTGMSVDPSVPPMKLRLTADAQGELTGIQLNDITFGTQFNKLHLHIISIVGGDQPDSSFRESAELEIDFDYQLRYEYVIEAITAVTGYRTPENEVVKLIEKIRFSPPKSPPRS